LRATPEQLCDALGACTELNTVYRRLLKMALEELRLIEEQIGYNSPDYLKARHALPQELLQNIAVVETLAAKAEE